MFGALTNPTGDLSQRGHPPSTLQIYYNFVSDTALKWPRQEEPNRPGLHRRPDTDARVCGHLLGDKGDPVE